MKKKILVLVFFIISLTSCVSTHNLNSPVEPAKLSPVDTARHATVAFIDTIPAMRIETDDGEVIERPERTFPYCTGVWLNQETIMTAFHCTQAADTLAQIKKLPPALRPFAAFFIKEADTTKGVEMLYVTEEEVNGVGLPTKTKHNSTVVATDKEHDLAIIKVEKENIPYHTWLRVSDTMPKVGDKVSIVGHPAFLYFTFMDGTVSAIRETFPTGTFGFQGPFIQIYSAVYNGNSGGPVISDKGELIGIVSFSPRAPNQSFAIAAPSLKRFIIRSHYNNEL